MLNQYSATVQFSLVAQLCPTVCDPWTAARQASLSITNSWSPLKLTSIELVMPSNHFILYLPLLLQLPIFPIIRFFSNESVLHIRWPKYWSFSFSIKIMIFILHMRKLTLKAIQIFIQVYAANEFGKTW